MMVTRVPKDGPAIHRIPPDRDYSLLPGRPLSFNPHRWFNGQFIPAETGEEETWSTQEIGEVIKKVYEMKDGDSLVINMSESR
jgi:hypothetical protein